MNFPIEQMNFPIKQIKQMERIKKSNTQIKQIASAKPNEPIKRRLLDRANAPNQTKKSNANSRILTNE